MSKRTALHLLITCLLFLWAVVYNYLHKDTDLLRQYAGEISNFIEKNEQDAQKWVVDNQESIKKLTFEGLTLAEKAQIIKTITQKEDKLFTILLHKEDSLLYWSNNKVIPNKEEMGQFLKQADKSLLHLVVGDYYAVRVKVNNVHLTTLIPIKYRINIEKNQLQNLYPANHFIPDLVKISKVESPYPLVVNNQKIAYLESIG
jgi:hypothetical protein